MEPILLGLGAGLVALATLAAGLFRRGKEKALGDPRLVISPAPYGFGEVVPCRVASVVRRPIRVERVRFTLRCLESVRWNETETDGRGRRRQVERTKSSTVWTDDQMVAFGRELRAGERFEAEADLRLPEKGGPTFSALHNEIGWQVVLAVEQADGVLLEQVLSIVVEPRRRFTPPPRPR